MEIMYANKSNDYFKESKINGFYKDKNDLINYLPNFYGIEYDDEWLVKKFLFGFKIKKNQYILDIIKKVNLNENILNKKIKKLSTNEFKLVLLSYLLYLNPDVFIFDYFEVGLSYKNKKMFINLIKKLRSDGKTIIVISNNISFLYEVSDYILMIENRKLIYKGKINDFVKVKFKDEPLIFNFIRKANKKGAKLLYTIDRKELIKDIYRSLR